ncbi:hypothetical protein Fot_06180 [Forsythia ovata]|uniref:Uncharacterized protein n=1 Tax=Forsythia ovata TaxID=205694 RepID=A0ABD1WSM0_9LAMI
MGACISVDKGTESAMKLQLSAGSKTEKVLILSPVKEKPETVTGRRYTIADVALKSQSSPPVAGSTFRDSGSKEETFFDSQAWLESDCEDDFLSVNGDFTPSRGSTPVHNNFSAGTPRVSQAELSPGSTTPPEKRKKLSELFRESLQGDQDADKQNAASNENEVAAKVEHLPKSAKWTVYVPRANSGYSREKTTNGAFRAEDKSANSVQCCLPRLLSSSRSCTERMMTSPVHR